MEGLKNDLTIAFRMFLKTPAVTAVAILSLALGIGANTAIFSLFNSLFLHSLPYVQEPERLIKIYDQSPLADYGGTSYLDYRDYRQGAQVFSELIAYGAEAMSLDIRGMPERIRGEIVTGNYFSALGVRPAVGRVLSPQDDRPEAPPAVVLSHSLWQRSFGSDASVLGKSLRLNGNTFVVVGVAPARFRGLELAKKSELWVPMTMAPLVMTQGAAVLENRGYSLWYLAGHLKPGARQEQAKANLATVARQLDQQFPGPFPHNPVLVPATEASFSNRGAVSRFVGLLMAVVGLVLLIACVNIANLMLARTARRRRELSVRQVLGADRGRLARQLLTESLLLALLGAAVGLALARLLLPLLARFQLPAEIVLDLDLDVRVLGFTVALALLTGILVGLGPALRSSRLDLVSALKDTGSEPGTMRGLGLRSFFVVAQVALSLLLLIGAGLFLKSLQRLQSIDPGVEPENLVVMSLDVGAAGYSKEQGKAFYQQLVERIESLPGVTSASVASALPIQADFSSFPFFSSEATPEAKEGIRASVNLVGPDYFRTIGLPLLQGRDFILADAGPPTVCIVNQTLADRFWPRQNPIGKRLRFGGADGDLLEVIGVAKNGKYGNLREEPQPFAYLPYRQVYKLFTTTKHVLVRSAAAPARLFAESRREVQALDKNLPVFDTRTMESYLSTFLAQERQTAVLLLLLASLALLLASIGLYGVMSYSVAQRTREIGIRMAMGAARGDVMWQLMTESVRLIVLGSVIGLAAALAATRLVSSVLYGVSPTDTATFALAFTVLAVVGIVAGFLPARRAASVNPLIAIRSE